MGTTDNISGVARHGRLLKLAGASNPNDLPFYGVTSASPVKRSIGFCLSTVSLL